LLASDFPAENPRRQNRTFHTLTVVNNTRRTMARRKILGILLFSVIFISATSVSKKLIKWNFDEYTTLTYEYNQSMLTDVEFFDDAQKMMMTAYLIIKIKNKQSADVIFTNIKQFRMSKDSLGTYKVTDTIEMPNQILFQDLTPEGNIDGDIQQSNLMLARTLFPITNQKMKIGETTDLKMTMPFNMMGSNINVKGYNRIKYVSSNDGIEKLSTLIDVSEYTIPEEIEQDYICYLKGYSDFSFDSKRGVFNDGIINLNMAMGINITDSTTTKETAKMFMDMNTEIRLKLIKTE
jgi:hypothetical protein